jgi:uncharacterized protein YhdP
MDSKPWPRGALALAWIPEQDVGGTSNKRSDELRIRASNLDLAAVEGLRSMAAKLSPDLGEIWLATQPSGQIETLALDIPLQATEKPASRRHGKTWPGNSGNCCQARSTLAASWKAALRTAG